MCYAIPGRVIEIQGRVAIVDYFGEKRKVLNDLVDAKVGDYVYAQGGILIDKINENDALEILAFWEKEFFNLKNKDRKLAQFQQLSGESEILDILQKINLKKELTKNEILKLLKVEDREDLISIYQLANSIRQREHGNASCVHGIIEFSNYCKNNCFYCGLRRDRKIKRYRLTKEEIIQIAEYAVKEFGFKALVLQSGEDYYYTTEEVIDIIKELSKLKILIFLSLGIREKNEYEKFYEAGARAYLLRFETSNKNIFNKLRPGTSFEERIETIKFLKKIGYVIATGFLIGLPDETDEDIINNIFLAKSFQPDMYSFGPFIPTPETPLENLNPVNEEKILKIIAITRFIDNDANILVTTAFETLSKDAKRNGLLSGANSLMINVTPPEYRRLYDLYPKRPMDDSKKMIKDTINLLLELGRSPTDLGLSRI